MTGEDAFGLTMPLLLFLFPLTKGLLLLLLLLSGWFLTFRLVFTVVDGVTIFVGDPRDLLKFGEGIREVYCE